MVAFGGGVEQVLVETQVADEVLIADSRGAGDVAGLGAVLAVVHGAHAIVVGGAGLCGVIDVLCGGDVVVDGAPRLLVFRAQDDVVVEVGVLGGLPGEAVASYLRGGGEQGGSSRSHGIVGDTGRQQSPLLVRCSGHDTLHQGTAGHFHLAFRAGGDLDA